MPGSARWIVPFCAAIAVAGCSSAIAGQGAASSSSPPPATQSRSADFPSTTAPSSAPSTGAAATVTVTASASSSAAATVPAGFVGTWYGHGRTLTMSPDGAVAIDFRTYVTCTATVTTGCDQVKGNAIIDGGHVRGTVSQVLDPTTVMVTLTASTAPSELAAGTYRLGHDVHHHALALFAGQWNQAPFCGAGAPSGYCGA